MSRLNLLNDPFECKPAIVADERSKQPLADTVGEKLFQKRAAQFGIISFSSVWAETLLWSHYGDCHKGICLVIRQPRSDSLWKVKYCKDRPSVTLNQLLSDDASTFIAALVDAVRTKSLSWKYEREYRFLPELAKCEPINGHYFTPIHPSAFVGVILGIRCPIEESYVRRILNQRGLTSASVWRASASASSFAVERTICCE